MGRNQLYNCTHFRHPTDEQLQHSYIFLATTIICSLSTLNTLTPPLRSPIGQRRGSRSSPSAALANRIAALGMRMLYGHHRTHAHDRVIRAICQTWAAISAL